MASDETAPGGLTSQEAQHRLLGELTAVISKHITINWLKEIRKCPYSIIYSILIGLAGLILVIYYGITVNEQRSVVLFQAIFLIFLASFNVCLFGWGVYMQKTQRMRHLMTRLKPVLDSLCLWTAKDYPKSPISTLRGNLTIPAYRDAVLVNLPISLLVPGDLIEVDAGMPCPANAMLVESDSGSGISHIGSNETLPKNLFKESDAKVNSSISFLPEVKPVRLVVEESPILPSIESSIKKTASPSILAKEIDKTVSIVLVLALIVYAISLIVNVIRFFSLSDDFDDSWPEIILAIPVFTSLPLLLIQLPLVWSLMNLYGVARITQLVDHGPHYFEVNRCKRIVVFFQTLVVMVKLIFWCSLYPAYTIFHTLGTLTSVCAIDKEYLLTSGFPSPEKVFFLRTEDIADETKQDIVVKKSDSLDSRPDLDSDKALTMTTSGVKFKMTSSDDDTGDLVMDNTEINLQHSEVEFQIGSTPHEGELVKPEGDQLQLQKQSLQMLDSISALSDTVPFELVTEILVISRDPTAYSGIAFDDINWQRHIGSLKPIGVNLLATSHLTKAPFQLSSDCCKELRMHLHQSCCSCSLGMEIGVAEYFTNNFEKQVMLYSVSNPNLAATDFHIHRRSTTATLVANSNSTVPPHLFSTIVKENASNKTLVMSRGSANLIASCCSDFWDGSDLQPMTDTERISIVNYYNCRSLSSYCIALAYNPIPEDILSTSLLQKSEIGLYIPSAQYERNQSDMSLTMSLRESESQLSTAEQVFKNLQCNQVFLGLVSLQFLPKYDITSLIEDLDRAGIRFVHFTAENELRGKIFAQKLGLEADWNCFISLAPTLDEDVDSGQENKEESLNGENSDFGSRESSLASSVLSVFNATMSNILAKLPKGIHNIRPHISEVDNVPLLVSLFTDCTADTMTEMIKIMQENHEVVLCIGNAWNHENINVFSQADISLSVIPQYVDLPSCTVTETCPLSTSNSSQNTSSMSREKSIPTPLEVASYLNSASCQLCFGRDSDVSLLSLIAESRSILSSIHLGLLFGLGASLSLSVMMILSSLFFLPPPLSGSHLIWFLVFTIPLMMLSFLATPFDPEVKSLMPSKRMDILPNKWMVIMEFFALFVSTSVVVIIIFGLTLRDICIKDISNVTCHLFLGDRDVENTSPWNGWRGTNEQGLLFAQDLVAFFINLYMVILSIRFIHRTQPLWNLWKFASWQYIFVVSAVVLLQIIYFAVSQSIVEREFTVITHFDSVPVSAWCIGFGWSCVIIVMLEILKYLDKRKLFEAQKLLRLQFGTKLGMHSPV